MVIGYDNLDCGQVSEKLVSGLTPATDYYYRVRCQDSTGVYSDYSVTTMITTGILAPPSAFPTSDITDLSFSLNWNWLSGTNGVAIDLATDAGFTTFVPGYENKIIETKWPLTTLSINTGITPSTTYYFRIRSWIYPGDAGSTSANSNVITFTTLATPPPPVKYINITTTTTTFGPNGGDGTCYVNSNDDWTVTLEGDGYISGATSGSGDGFFVYAMGPSAIIRVGFITITGAGGETNGFTIEQDPSY
jgi:hypothetical protein